MEDYKRDISRAFSNGKLEGMNFRKRIFNKKIDDKIFQIEKLKEDFKRYVCVSEDEEVEKFWYEETKKLIEFLRILKDLKEEI